MPSILYGPVSSWRMGRSLGVDMLSGQQKLCSFDCVYCQLGSTVRPVARRKEFVSLDQLKQEIEVIGHVDVDYATFSGMGEPTLASNLGEAIELVRSNLKVPVAVLTNSSLMVRQDVRNELARADVVVAKLDAPDETLFHQINRPRIRCRLSEILEAIRLFRDIYRRKLAIAMMFIDANKDRAAEMARLIRELCPDEVQLNTPLRPCTVKPLPPEEIAEIHSQFSGFESVVAVYQTSPPTVKPIDMAETGRRRPEFHREETKGRVL
ncbi:MAG: radical SAM protein [Dehalococcoidales bacterium]|nr:MAG: radical SAM protein [Dehalococcoidales bacterium]